MRTARYGKRIKAGDSQRAGNLSRAIRAEVKEDY